MRLALCSLLLPFILASDAPPISKGLQPPLILASDAPPISKGLQLDDDDLLTKGRFPSRTIKARAHGVLQDEVSGPPGFTGKTQNDDYNDFSDEPVKNGGANHHLKRVSYQPIPKKYEIPSLEPEDVDEPP
ncbi:unnamed protein product, partial [Strongylus vulgaris]